MIRIDKFNLNLNIISPIPRTPAIKNPNIPRSDTPNKRGDIPVVIIIDEPTISADIIKLKDTLLLVTSSSSTSASLFRLPLHGICGTVAAYRSDAAGFYFDRITARKGVCVDETHGVC
ncbi:MAG: hypothetical protein PHH85_04530 [Candidatus Methanoperedens sp.]|nr:hypothetical protein [Candidatus Methanoperedens sp.]